MGFGYALGQLHEESRTQIERLSKTIEQLRIELAEQRGEVFALRELRTDKVIDLPKWRNHNAA